MKHARTKPLRNILFILYLFLSSFLILAIIELTLRFLGINPPFPPYYSNAFWAKHDMLGYTAIPNARWSFLVTNKDAEDTSMLEYTRKIGSANKYGFRPVVTNNNCSDCPEVIILGDSLTFGAESNDNETWPEKASIYLKTKGINYKFRNIAMRGYSTVQSYRALKMILDNNDFIDDKSDINLVVYAFFLNDIVENFSRFERPRPYLNSSMEINKPLETAEWDSAFERNEYLGRLTSIKYNLALFSFLDLFRNNKSQTVAVPGFDENYYLKRGKHYYNLINQDYFLPFFESEDTDLKQKGLHLLLRSISSECRKRSIPFVVLNVPFPMLSDNENSFALADKISAGRASLKEMLANQRKIISLLKKYTDSSGGIYLDIDTNIFSDLTYKEYTASPHDWHYSVLANKRLAEEIVKQLIKKNLL
jgi:hypothetical protein